MYINERSEEAMWLYCDLCLGSLLEATTLQTQHYRVCSFSIASHPKCDVQSSHSEPRGGRALSKLIFTRLTPVGSSSGAILCLGQ